MNKKKVRRPVLLIAAAAAMFGVAACDPKPEVKNQGTASPTPAATSSPAISPEIANPNEAALQKLLGKWEGSGGYINITDKKGPDGKQLNPREFDIEIKSADKTEKFEGTAKGSDIEFTRNGKTETVKAAIGSETGIKALEKETTCVVVTKGTEAYCRKTDTNAKTPATSPSPSPAKK